MGRIRHLAKKGKGGAGEGGRKAHTWRKNGNFRNRPFYSEQPSISGASAEPPSSTKAPVRRPPGMSFSPQHPRTETSWVELLAAALCRQSSVLQLSDPPLPPLSPFLPSAGCAPRGPPHRHFARKGKGGEGEGQFIEQHRTLTGTVLRREAQARKSPGRGPWSKTGVPRLPPRFLRCSLPPRQLGCSL